MLIKVISEFSINLFIDELLKQIFRQDFLIQEKYFCLALLKLENASIEFVILKFEKDIYL